jgi:hypothetical protein
MEAIDRPTSSFRLLADPARPALGVCSIKGCPTRFSTSLKVRRSALKSRHTVPNSLVYGSVSTLLTVDLLIATSRLRRGYLAASTPRRV